MPHFIFLTLAAIIAGIGLMVLHRSGQPEAAETAAKAAANEAPKELDWDDVEQVDPIGLEIGYGLIPLVNPETGGQLMARVKGVRKKLTAELGFLVQPVRIRDALNIDPDSYHIVLHGVIRGRGEVKVGRELAINPGKVYGTLEGLPTREPAFGLDAVWIDPAQRDYARTLGYTVVDPSTAIATHMNKVLRDNAADLLSHDEVQQLLDKLAARSPKLVEDLVPGKLALGVITRTLQNRARRRAKPNAQFTRHNLRERGLPKARRAMKQNMIHRLSPRPRGTDENAQILPQATLPGEVIQRLRAERHLSAILLKPGGG
jgi:flagellar biosynthesis protein FlhA